MSSLGRFRRIVGLDIGTCLIKAVEVKKAGGKVEITNFGVCPTPQGVISNGRVMDPPKVALAVKEALNVAGIRGREVCAAVAGSEVIVRHVLLPRMPKDELAQAVKWEAGAYIPYPMDEANIDSDVIGAAYDSSDKVEVMIVAAPKSFVESHVVTMELAGVKPLFLDIQPITICRVFSDGKPQDSQFFVDIGGGTTDLVYSEEGVLRFTRIVNIGGNTFTEAIARACNQDYLRAEKIKRNLSLVETDDSERDVIVDSESKEAAREVARKLATEVRRSMDYCSAQARVRNGERFVIDEVVLTGGGSKLAGLREYLEASLGLRVAVGDSLADIAFARNAPFADDLAAYGTSLAVAIGLALRGVDGQ